MESSIKVLANHLGLLEHHLEFGIVHKSAVVLIWTIGTSSRGMAVSIKVLVNHLR